MNVIRRARSVGLLWLVALAAFSACSDSTEPEIPWLRIEPTKTHFSPGDVVSVTLRNAGTTPIDIDACFPQMQRFDAGEWIDVNFTRPNCGGIGMQLSAGAERVINVDILPLDLTDGTYRYRFAAAHLIDNHQTPLSASALRSTPFLIARNLTSLVLTEAKMTRPRRPTSGPRDF